MMSKLFTYAELLLLCAEKDKRIADLERNNSLMATRIAEGWIAPNEPDQLMLSAAMPWLKYFEQMNRATKEANLEEAYKAMRQAYLKSREEV
jgi:hypothetical protein